jgi:N-acyl-L-homoserine lactone synthetase
LRKRDVLNYHSTAPVRIAAAHGIADAALDPDQLPSVTLGRPLLEESPLIWECSRFSIEPTIVHERVSRSALRRTTFELMHGGCEVALMAGVEQDLGIFDPFMLRVYGRTGWGPEIIASTEQLGPHVVYFGIWDVSEANSMAIRERSGITGSVPEDTTPVVKAVA